MSDLYVLRQGLSNINARMVVREFGDAQSMLKVADELEQKFGEGRQPDQEIVAKILLSFLETGTLKSYREIKTASYGVAVPLVSGRSLVQARAEFGKFLRLVDQYRADPRRLKRCFQALLAAYFSIDGCDEESMLHQQWQTLRLYLATWLSTLAPLAPKPDWLAAAEIHRDLLDENPTMRYGAALLQGDAGDFEHACVHLGISQSSWVRRQVVLSAIEAATSQDDAKFNAHLERLIGLLQENDFVRSVGAAKLLNRYAEQRTVSEHAVLRTFAINTFGNPLINSNKPRWSEVSSDAREMVSNWLKGYLIERFFELLSQDGRTDKRRPKFWLKYRESIETVWFVLGSSAMSNWNQDFKKLRETMGNQCLSLEGATPGNNAFVMTIGKVHVVEFGEKGNATYVFDSDSLPFDLSRRHLSLVGLKHPNHLERLLHMDGRQLWEDKFSDALSHYGVYPDRFAATDPASMRRRANTRQPTAGISTPSNFEHVFRKFCADRGLRFEDTRSRGGELVVYTDAKNGRVSGTLGQWGFVFDRARERWVKKR